MVAHEQEEFSQEINHLNFYINVYLMQIYQIKNTSEHVNDGLKNNNAFITAALKCVPPQDKPEKKRINELF